jgi:hypothetical protein
VLPQTIRIQRVLYGECLRVLYGKMTGQFWPPMLYSYLCDRDHHQRITSPNWAPRPDAATIYHLSPALWRVSR